MKKEIKKLADLFDQVNRLEDRRTRTAEKRQRALDKLRSLSGPEDGK